MCSYWTLFRGLIVVFFVIVVSRSNGGVLGGRCREGTTY